TLPIELVGPDRQTRPFSRSNDPQRIPAHFQGQKSPKSVHEFLVIQNSNTSVKIVATEPVGPEG
ncbi:hypothetical protein H5410_042212, partial [Solanum commersonii]